MTKYERGFYLFDNDYNYLKEQMGGNSKVSGLVVNTYSSGLRFSLGSGSAVVNKNIYTIGETIMTFSADPSLPKKSIVYIGNGGIVGSASSSPTVASPAGNVGKKTKEPVPPSIPMGTLALAEIWIPGGATSSTQCEIFNYDIVTNRGIYWTYD